jgi:jumonji domain-containing protein 7
MQKWTNLQDILTGTRCSVNLTPNGYADAVICVKENGRDREYFVEGCETSMPFEQFWNMLQRAEEDKKETIVPYAQRQNDSLRMEFESLKDDVPANLGWAKQLLGVEDGALDAVNLWVGGSRSVSSIHKDPYENFYAVIKGKKIFTLLPPSAYPFLRPKKFPKAKFEFDSESREFKLKCIDPNECITWLSCDPDFYADELSLSNCSPLIALVNEGEMLYLPSLWFHQVSQQGITIAVNYWYDMKHTFSWAYFNFVQNLVDTKNCQEEREEKHADQIFLSAEFHSTRQISSAHDDYEAGKSLIRSCALAYRHNHISSTVLLSSADLLQLLNKYHISYYPWADITLTTKL